MFCVICFMYKRLEIIHLSHLSGKLSKINTKFKIYLNKNETTGTKPQIFIVHKKLQVLSSGSICQSQWDCSSSLHLPNKLLKKCIYFYQKHETEKRND